MEEHDLDNRTLEKTGRSKGATETIRGWQDLEETQKERYGIKENKGLKTDHSTYRAVCHSLCGVIVRGGANLSYQYAGYLITIFFSEET